MSLLKLFRNLFNPTSRIDQLISRQWEKQTNLAKTWTSLKPVRDRALAKSYELDIQAVPIDSEERVLTVSVEEAVKIATVLGSPRLLYGLKLIYEST